MTENRAQKNAIRQRMAETGESYSAARRAIAGDGSAARPGHAWDEKIHPNQAWDEKIHPNQAWDERLRPPGAWSERFPGAAFFTSFT